MWPFRKLDLTTFTADDWRIISSCTPPGAIFRFLAYCGHRIGFGDPSDSITISYMRAENENNRERLLSNPYLPPHVEKYLRDTG